MIRRSPGPSLTDIVEACEPLCAKFSGDSLEARWLIERGIKIISEASRRLPDELKARHPDIPWRKVAGIGNILRHDYDSLSTAVLLAVVQHDLEPLEQVCRTELTAEQNR